MIKKLLRPLVRWVRAKICPSVVPVVVSETKSYGQMAVRNRYADIKEKLATESPVIIDGGANNGSTTDYFLQQYRSPVIHAFEPIPELVEQLKAHYADHQNVIVHGAALGAEVITVSFNVVNNLVSSSVLNPSALNRGIHGKNMDVRQVVEVQQVRLEDVMGADGEVDLLKLDLQGYEMEALKGCGKLLERVKIITTEIEFVSLYDGQPLFGDIDVYLRAHGFRLLNLYELYTHPNAQLTAGDAVYLNSKYFRDASTPDEKIADRILNPDGSISIDDPATIKSFTDNPDFPYMVSFSRTGSHWLRMIMELYFGKPSLIRAFYFKDASDFTCYHTHDMELGLMRENVIYLYRNPVETVYSQLCYYKEDIHDEGRRRHWTNLYARHLAKWLAQENFTRKKTVITYEGMQANMADEFARICQHFGEKLDAQKLEAALEKVSKAELKKKTAHDEQVVNLTAEYQKNRKLFADKYAEQIYMEIFSCEPELRRWLQPGHQ
ncbi:MAG: FkbM family methyltransferase [Nitrosomonadales bacterium]|nr:FkbM family methyltransferase [Nitrosomonadales bacterium]